MHFAQKFSLQLLVSLRLVINLFLLFHLLSGSCSYKIILIKKEYISLSFCLLSFILLFHLHSFFVYKRPISVLKKGVFLRKKAWLTTFLGAGPPDLLFSFTPGAMALRDFSLEPPLARVAAIIIIIYLKCRILSTAAI